MENKLLSNDFKNIFLLVLFFSNSIEWLDIDINSGQFRSKKPKNE
jgi:hypothetical protein